MMSVSYFEALELQIPVVEARAQLAAAQAALYPHTTKQGAERLWKGWVNDAYPPASAPARGQTSSRFTLNGRPVSIAELRDGLGKALGAGLSA